MAPPLSAGRQLPDGRRVYRLTASQVVWWAWVGLAVLSLGDLIIQGHNYVSLKFALGLLTVTGAVFACTIWPRVIADDAGLVVHNPFRTFTIPWMAVRGIFLGDSVEIQCARAQQKKDKTVYSWALSSARRGRARARLHGWQWEQGKRTAPRNFGQLPGHAKDLVKMTPTEVIAREMARLSEDAKARLNPDGEPPRGAADQGGGASAGLGVGEGTGRTSLNGSSPAEAGGDPAGAAVAASAGLGAAVTAVWSWPALAAIVVPGIAFAIVMLVG